MGKWEGEREGFGFLASGCCPVNVEPPLSASCPPCPTTNEPPTISSQPPTHWRDWLWSLAIHGTVIGAATLGLLRVPSAQDTGSVPIYFEVIEASAIESGPVPSDMPDDAGPVPMNAGSVPNDGEVELDENRNYFDEKLEVDVGMTIEASQSDKNASAEDEDESPRVAGEKMSSIGSVGRSEESEKGEPLVAEQEERAKVVSDPIVLNRIVPVYPRSARRRGHEGCVTLDISVAEDGGIAQAEVVASSGYVELDEAALAAVRSAHFAPATEDGVSVRGELRLTFDFRLR